MLPRSYRAPQKLLLTITLIILTIITLLTLQKSETTLTAIKTAIITKTKIFGASTNKNKKNHKKTKINQEIIYETISQEEENLAAYFWYDQTIKQQKQLKHNETCAPIADLQQIHFNNNWQVLQTKETEVQLYRAYLDNRDQNPLGPVVRLLGIIKNYNEEKQTKFYCQIWTLTSNRPIITKVFSVEYLWRDYWGKPQPEKHHPYMLTCVLPEEYPTEDVQPQAVSLVAKPCDKATNLLKIYYETQVTDSLQHVQPFMNKFSADQGVQPPKICVCIKGTNEINDKSQKLIEYFEWLRLAGINQVYINIYNVHPNMEKVLQYYSSTINFVRVNKMFSSPPGPNTFFLQYLYLKSPKYNLQLDMLAFNDCLLRNMYNYDFVIPLELDEIVVIKGEIKVGGKINTIQDVLLDLPPNKDGYALSRIPFVRQDVGGVLGDDGGMFVDNVYRLQAKKGEVFNTKSLFSTKTMVMIHNHYGFESLTGKITTEYVGDDVAVVEQHLDEVDGCGDDCKQKKVMDLSKWEFKDVIVGKVKEIVDFLGLE